MFKVKSFPNKNTAGTFSPFDQVIRLDGFTRKDIENCLNGDLIFRWEKLFPIYRTVFHEYTHFLDMTTTTYGLSLISAIYGGAQSFSKGKDSTTDISAAAARAVISELDRDEMHAQVLGSYRKTWGFRDWYADAKPHAEDPVHVLTGLIFINPENKKEFARVPFSIPSMMESNALANELFICYVYGKSNIPQPADKQKLEGKVNLEILRLIYDERFCIYSVCFHRCANVLQLTDIIDASRASSLICEMCLNVAPITLANMSPPDATLAFLGSNLRGRIIDEIRSGSRPLLFFMLTSLLANAKHSVNQYFELRNELEINAGLKNFAEDAAKAKSGLLKILKLRNISNPQYENLIEIIDKNISIEKNIPIYNFHDYELPAVLLRDNSIFDLNSNFYTDKRIGKFDPSQHASWMADYQNWL